MSLTEAFSDLSFGVETASPPKRRKRHAPFAIRLNREERARLEGEAKGMPLGTYIKAKVLGSAPALRMRRTGLAIEDRTALAQVLALLGRSRLSSNLNQLAHAANIGALPTAPETKDLMTVLL